MLLRDCFLSQENEYNHHRRPFQICGSGRGANIYTTRNERKQDKILNLYHFRIPFLESLLLASCPLGRREEGEAKKEWRNVYLEAKLETVPFG